MSEFVTEDGVVSVGDGVRLTGEIHAQDTVVVDGAFSGEITCKRLVVGQTGVVEGRISVFEADIHGKVTGDVVARQSLVARATARIEGTWLVGEIVAERGAILNGKSGGASPRSEIKPAPTEEHAPAPSTPLLAPTRIAANVRERRFAVAGK